MMNEMNIAVLCLDHIYAFMLPLRLIIINSGDFFTPDGNECGLMIHDCDNISQVCVDTPEAFDCVCKAGFNGSVNGSCCKLFILLFVFYFFWRKTLINQKEKKVTFYKK